MRRSFRSGTLTTRRRWHARRPKVYTGMPGIHDRPLAHSSCGVRRRYQLLYSSGQRGVCKSSVPRYPRTLNSVTGAISDLEAIWNGVSPEKSK